MISFKYFVIVQEALDAGKEVSANELQLQLIPSLEEAIVTLMQKGCPETPLPPNGKIDPRKGNYRRVSEWNKIESQSSLYRLIKQEDAANATVLAIDAEPTDKVDVNGKFLIFCEFVFPLCSYS